MAGSTGGGGFGAFGQSAGAPSTASNGSFGALLAPGQGGGAGFGAGSTGTDWRSLLGGFGGGSPLAGPMPAMPMPASFQSMPGYQAQLAGQNAPSPFPGPATLPPPPPPAAAPAQPTAFPGYGTAPDGTPLFNSAQFYSGGA
jgi:hypothetical protein